MIYMQAGWFRVKQTVGPKHTNTSGDYSAGAVAVLHQMLPRSPTTNTHTVYIRMCVAALINEESKKY